MTPIRKVLKFVVGALIAAFVLVHLSVLLILNLKPFFKTQSVPLAEEATDYSYVLGVHQRWNMFSPNVGNSADTPVIVITMKDGSTQYLYALTESGLPKDVALHNATGTPVAWVVHVGDGRIRKLESRVTNPEPAYWSVRMRYVQIAMEQWRRENPALAPKVAFTRLAAVSIRYAGPQPRPAIGGMRFIDTMPFSNPAWQVPIPPGVPMGGPGVPK